MSRLCGYCNKYPVFSHDFCRLHQWMRTDEDYKKYKNLKKEGKIKQKSIPKESKKRKEEKKTYKQVKDELREELKAKNEWVCFFCTKDMKDEKEFHHLKGRDGQNFIDKKWLVPAHGQCHVLDYHMAKVKDLMKQEWYQGFLTRLKEKDTQLYYKEIVKQEKAELEFET